jgi:hypothetical protein
MGQLGGHTVPVRPPDSAGHGGSQARHRGRRPAVHGIVSGGLWSRLSALDFINHAVLIAATLLLCYSRSPS